MVEVENQYNYVLIKEDTKGDTEIELDFVVFGVWKNGGYIKSAKEFKDYTYYVKQQQASVKTNILSTEEYKK